MVLVCVPGTFFSPVSFSSQTKDMKYRKLAAAKKISFGYPCPRIFRMSLGCPERIILVAKQFVLNLGCF